MPPTDEILGSLLSLAAHLECLPDSVEEKRIASLALFFISQSPLAKEDDAAMISMIEDLGEEKSMANHTVVGCRLLCARLGLRRFHPEFVRTFLSVFQTTGNVVVAILLVEKLAKLLGGPTFGKNLEEASQKLMFSSSPVLLPLKNLVTRNRLNLQAALHDLMLSLGYRASLKDAVDLWFQLLDVSQVQARDEEGISRKFVTLFIWWLNQSKGHFLKVLIFSCIERRTRRDIGRVEKPSFKWNASFHDNDSAEPTILGTLQELVAVHLFLSEI